MPTFKYNLPWDDSDDESNEIEIPELKSSYENYLEWSSDVRAMLRIRGLWELVENDPTEANLRSRGQVAALILLAMGSTSIGLHHSPEYMSKDPKALWASISENARQHFNAYNIRVSLSNTFLDDFPSVLEYTLKIDTLIRQLEFAKSKHSEWKMPKDEHTFWYLHGLPGTWGEKVMQIRIYNIPDGNELSEDEKNVMFNHHKLRHKLMDYEDILRRQRDGNKTCWKCKQKGHVQKDCRMVCKWKI